MGKFMAGLVALLLCAPLAWASPPANPGQMRSASSSTAAAQLRRAYYAQDFSRVVEEGKPLLAQFPSDLDLRAWYVAANVREGNFQLEALDGEDDLEAVVNEMKRSAPASPWTLLAAAAAGNDLQEQLALCDKAIAGDRANSDLLVVATDVVRQATSWPPEPEALKKFLAEHKTEYERSANGLAAEAQAFDALGTMEKDAKSTAASKAALDLAGRALALDPENVAALLLKSRALVKKQEYRANYDLLKAAARSRSGGTDSYALHQAYWQAVLALPDAKPAERKREIMADAARIVSAVKPSTETARMALFGMYASSPAVAVAMGDLLLREYPHSGVEDAVLLARATPVEAVTEDERNAEIAALEAFIARPKHYDARLLVEANDELVDDMLDQENPDLERLYHAVLASQSSPRVVTTTRGITLLADHDSHLPELERLARKQLDAQWPKLDTIVKNARGSLKERVHLFLEYGAGSWLGALGWVEFQEGKLNDALPKLEEAAKLNPKDPRMAVHLGRYYEAKGDNAKAARIFRDALSMPYVGERDHPALVALRELYVHTHGGTRGLEAYMRPILAEDAARRQAAVLSTRMDPAKPLKPFALAGLDGKEVSSEGLKGKYLVLNFWATW